MPDCGICRKSAKPSPTAGCDFCGEGKFVIEWGELSEDIRAAKASAEAGKATEVHIAADEILRHPGTLELTLEQARFLNDLPWNIWPFCDLTTYANCDHCEFWHPARTEAAAVGELG